jgi:hypothetical protein
LGEATRQRREIEKIRRQKRKRSKRAKEKILQAKHHRVEVKEKRNPAVGQFEFLSFSAEEVW